MLASGGVNACIDNSRASRVPFRAEWQPPEEFPEPAGPEELPEPEPERSPPEPVPEPLPEELPPKSD